MAGSPIVGVRIPIKLPFKGITDNEEQFVSIKQPVAKFLGFKEATTKELEYTTKLNRKNKRVSGTPNPKDPVTVKRRRRPGYKQRSVRVIFQTGHAAGGGRQNTLQGKKVKIGKQTVASIQFPITRSVAINDVLEYFETGAGAKLNAIRIVDVTTGQGYPVVKARA
jgi:hypothetical protein